MSDGIYPTQIIHDDQDYKAFQELTGKRSIHSKDSIKFYEEELKADRFVISILRWGLLFPFHTIVLH